MTKTKIFTVMALTVACASLLLLDGGLERIGQVMLSVYALLVTLTVFAKDQDPEKSIFILVPARLSFAYVVCVSAYTGHMVIAFTLAVAWIVGWLVRTSRKLEAEKAQSKGADS